MLSSFWNRSTPSQGRLEQLARTLEVLGVTEDDPHLAQTILANAAEVRARYEPQEARRPR